MIRNKGNEGSMGIVLRRPVWNGAAWVGSALAGLLASACSSEPLAEPESDATMTSFLQFKEATPRELGSDAYIVQGDIAVHGDSALFDYFKRTLGQQVPTEIKQNDGLGRVQEPLAVNTVNGVDTTWSAAQKTNLTYCVSTSFGANQAAVVSAMSSATSAWSSVANVTFVYASAQNANCTAANNNVVFDVRPTSGQNYLARAFFPNYGRANRNILIDASAFTQASFTLAGILRHELGHVLGFRHEHTVGATSCYEDEQWRALTSYDSASVMHYPQCGGTGGNSLTLTTRDKNGAACLYGAAAGFTPDCSFHGVKYRAHVSNIGWLPTVLSGDIAGTTGQGRSAEAMTIQMSGTPAGIGICYTGHVANVGWQAEVCNGSVAGTVGQSLQLEAMKVRLTGAPAGCTVNYQAHVGGVGWQSPVSNNAVAGTTGQSRAIEALKVWTSGPCGF
jgi:hypothetical protein